MRCRCLAISSPELWYLRVALMLGAAVTGAFLVAWVGGKRPPRSPWQICLVIAGMVAVLLAVLAALYGI